MNPKSAFARFFLLFLCFASVNAAAQDDPLWARSQAPLQSLMISPISRPTSYIAEQWQVALAVTPGSIFAINEDYQLDYYTFEYRFDMLYSLSDKWQLGAFYSHRTTNSSRLDQLTLTFHDTFGLDQNGRDEVPKHRYLIDVPSAGIRVEDFENETFARHFELSLGYQLWQKREHQLSTTASLQYNDERFFPREGDELDGAIQLDYSYDKSDKHRFNAMVAAAFIGAEELLGTETRQALGHLGVGYRYRLSPHHHFIAEYRLAQSALKSLGQLNNEVHEINLGYQYRRKRWGFDFVIMENAENADNSADIAFNFRVSYRTHAD